MIITGANKEYKPFYDKLKEDCQKFGYDFRGYDYGGLGDGENFDVKLKNPTENGKYVGKIPEKPQIILGALNRYQEFIVYLDADVRIMQPFNVEGDYDIGITAHDPRFQEGDEPYLHITGYLNAGVIFINNTDGARKFINEWIKDVEFSTTGSDQEALTNLLRRHITDWTKQDHDVLGVKVRLFPSAVYNYTGIRGECDNPILRHYTGIIQDKIAHGALN